MKLNVEKTKTMIFNFTDKYQFSTRLLLDDAPLEIVDKAKLLGTIIENDLSWDENIKSLVKKAYQRTIQEQACRVCVHRIGPDGDLDGFLGHNFDHKYKPVPIHLHCLSLSIASHHSK